MNKHTSIAVMLYTAASVMAVCGSAGFLSGWMAARMVHMTSSHAKHL